MGPLFIGPFSNERERSALLPAPFFRATFQRGLKKRKNYCVWTPVIVFGIWCARGFESDGGI